MPSTTRPRVVARLRVARRIGDQIVELGLRRPDHQEAIGTPRRQWAPAERAARVSVSE